MNSKFGEVKGDVRIGKMSCRQYEAVRDGKRRFVVWTTTLESMEINRSEGNKIEKIGELVDYMARTCLVYMNLESKTIKSLFNGVPIGAYFIGEQRISRMNYFKSLKI
jgi:hypothetical protein